MSSSFPNRPKQDFHQEIRTGKLITTINTGLKPNFYELDIKILRPLNFLMDSTFACAFHDFPQKTIAILFSCMALARFLAKVDDRGNERAKVLSLRKRI